MNKKKVLLVAIFVLLVTLLFTSVVTAEDVSVKIDTKIQDGKDTMDEPVNTKKNSDVAPEDDVKKAPVSEEDRSSSTTRLRGMDLFERQHRMMMKRMNRFRRALLDDNDDNDDGFFGRRFMRPFSLFHENDDDDDLDRLFFRRPALRFFPRDLWANEMIEEKYKRPETATETTQVVEKKRVMSKVEEGQDKYTIQLANVPEEFKKDNLQIKLTNEGYTTSLSITSEIKTDNSQELFEKRYVFGNGVVDSNNVKAKFDEKERLLTIEVAKKPQQITTVAIE